jgi:hypothetical protein
METTIRVGFSRTNLARLKPLETQLLQTIRPENCRREHRIFTAKPHMAGSVRNYELAQYVAEQWRKYGLENVELIEHPVYLPWPVRYEATLVNANEKLSLKEEPIPQDKDSYSDDVGIPYCAYSADVDVTAAVVYVNSGNPEDYDLLAQNGVDVRGKSRSRVTPFLTAIAGSKRRPLRSAASLRCYFIPIRLMMDSRKGKFIHGVRGGLRVTCNEEGLFTISICRAIHAHQVGLRFLAVDFFLLRAQSRCRQSQPRRCPTKTRAGFWKR